MGTGTPSVGRRPAAGRVGAGRAGRRLGRLNIADDYFLAGRQLPWYAVAVSLAAAGLGLESLLGMAGLAYKEGMAPAALCWGNFLAYSVLLWVVVPYLVRKKLSSMGELLERRFARSTRAVYAAVMLAFMIFGVLAPALAAAGAAVCDAGLGRPPEGSVWLFIVAMVVVAAAAGVYIIYGGLAATSRAAMLQLLVVLAGGVLLVALGSRGLGGVEGVVKKNLAADPGRLGLLLPAASESLALDRRAHVLFHALAGLCRRHAVERRTVPGGAERVGRQDGRDRRGRVAGAAAGRAGAAGAGVLRPAGHARHQRSRSRSDLPAADPSGLFPGRSLGAAGRGLAVSAVVAAAMCVAGAVLNAASTLWSIDISQDMLLRTASEADMIRRGRWSSLAALVLGLAAAPLFLWWSQGLLVWIEETAAVAMPPLAVVLLAAFFWPRLHGRAATFTLVFGVAVGALLWAARWTLLDPPAWFFAPLTRAAVNVLACALAMAAGTILIAPCRYEPYDPDTAWNFRWARLPAREQTGRRGKPGLLVGGDAGGDAGRVDRLPVKFSGYERRIQALDLFQALALGLGNESQDDHQEHEAECGVDPEGKAVVEAGQEVGIVVHHGEGQRDRPS